MFMNGEGDRGGFAKDGDFKEASVYGVSQVGYLLKLDKRISGRTCIFGGLPLRGH